ncbi:MAG: hypothetical protein AAGA75_01905 [Cyanobacteria bacterium P01_E01_bin.6]
MLVDIKPVKPILSLWRIRLGTSYDKVDSRMMPEYAGRSPLSRVRVGTAETDAGCSTAIG